MALIGICAAVVAFASATSARADDAIAIAPDSSAAPAQELVSDSTGAVTTDLPPAPGDVTAPDDVVAPTTATDDLVAPTAPAVDPIAPDDAPTVTVAPTPDPYDGLPAATSDATPTDAALTAAQSDPATPGPGPLDAPAETGTSTVAPDDQSAAAQALQIGAPDPQDTAAGTPPAVTTTEAAPQDAATSPTEVSTSPVVAVVSDPSPVSATGSDQGPASVEPSTPATTTAPTVEAITVPVGQPASPTAAPAAEVVAPAVTTPVGSVAPTGTPAPDAEPTHAVVPAPTVAGSTTDVATTHSITGPSTSATLPLIDTTPLIQSVQPTDTTTVLIGITPRSEPSASVATASAAPVAEHATVEPAKSDAAAVAATPAATPPSVVVVAPAADIAPVDLELPISATGLTIRLVSPDGATSEPMEPSPAQLGALLWNLRLSLDELQGSTGKVSITIDRTGNVIVTTGSGRTVTPESTTAAAHVASVAASISHALRNDSGKGALVRASSPVHIPDWPVSAQSSVGSGAGWAPAGGGSSGGGALGVGLGLAALGLAGAFLAQTLGRRFALTTAPLRPVCFHSPLERPG